MNEQLVNNLKRIAAKACFADDPDGIVEDYACGNVDDAFEMGVANGKVQLAREILTDLNLTWED